MSLNILVCEFEDWPIIYFMYTLLNVPFVPGTMYYCATTQNMIPVISNLSYS